MRALIGFIGFLGLAVFGSAFALSYVHPTFVETIAREVVRIEIEKRVGESISALEEGKLVQMAIRISGANAEQIADLKRKVAEGLPEKIEAVVAEMLDADCECRKAIGRVTDSLFEGRIADLDRINERLAALIRSQYMEVSAALTREFRIFTGANALVFGLLGLTMMIRKGAGLQLALPAVVLVGAAGLVGSLYLFNQNWLHTILFSDYVGFSYFGYLALAVAALADVAFNRARVTTEIVNAMLQLIGSSLSAVPC